MRKKIQKIIDHIKGKKNFGVDNNFVYLKLKKHLNSDYFKELFEKDEKIIFKNKRFKILVKDIRKELYSKYGVFQIKRQWKKEELLTGLKECKNLDEIKKISYELLKLHSSTRERLNEYEKIYSEILKLKPRKILDLACGLNPIFMTLMNFKGDYYCYDFSSDDIELLNEYFQNLKKYGINGKAYVKDITTELNFQKADVCFLFKFLDLVEERKKYFCQLIKSLNCRYLVVSFSKKTLSMKKMRNTERKWFNNLLNKLNLDYKLIDFDDEYFYLITLK